MLQYDTPEGLSYSMVQVIRMTGNSSQQCRPIGTFSENTRQGKQKKKIYFSIYKYIYSICLYIYSCQAKMSVFSNTNISIVDVRYKYIAAAVVCHIANSC